MRRSVARLLEPALHRREPELHVRSTRGNDHAVIRVPIGLSLSTAGARWAPAALLLLATLSLAADQPGTNQSGAVPTTGVLSLSQLASDSTLIVEGVVTRTEALDEDRLRVYHVRVDRTAKG